MEYLYTIDQLELVAKKLLEDFRPKPIWGFFAPMGAGKTTLIAAICKQLGVEDRVTSPSFSLMNEYQAGNKIIAHMDWYRIENEAEAYRAGLAAALDQADYCFIEWPEKAPGLLPLETVKLGIEILNPKERRIYLI